MTNSLGWIESDEYEFWFEEIKQWMPCNCATQELREGSENLHRLKTQFEWKKVNPVIELYSARLKDGTQLKHVSAYLRDFTWHGIQTWSIDIALRHKEMRYRFSVSGFTTQEDAIKCAEEYLIKYEVHKQEGIK